MLGEISKRKTNTMCSHLHVEALKQKHQTHRKRDQTVVTRGRGRGRGLRRKESKGTNFQL